MQIGCCIPLEDSDAARPAGFDYLECPLVSLQADDDKATVEPILNAYRQSSLPVWAFNLFLPASLKVVGPVVDHARLKKYTTRALDRAREIGARVIVFGSGGARSIPEGFPRDEALDQIISFLHVVADVAHRNGVTVVIEPLNRKESNVINSVAEGVDLARQVDRESIRVLADFYHMDEEQEPLTHLSKYKDWLAHVHVADSGRRAPGTGQYPYPDFAAELHRAGYTGMVSIECRWQDFEAESQPAVQFLRQVFA